MLHKHVKTTNKRHHFYWNMSLSLALSLNPTSKLLLPIHFIKEVLCSQEEVIDFAALLVPLGGVVHPQL